MLAVVVSLNNLNFIILPNGHRPNVILLSQLFGKRGRHDLPPNVRGCVEMPFAVLASVRSHEGIELHFGFSFPDFGALHFSPHLSMGTRAGLQTPPN